MIRKIIGLSIFAGLLYSCHSSQKINIKGRYFLEDDDGEKYLVGYEVGYHENFLVLIDLYVFAVGYDNKYIVAKQHPQQNHHPTGDTVYYIIPFHNEYTDSPQDGILGPLTVKEYQTKSDELKINQLIWRL